jgi:hypothetical protein
MDQRDEQRVRDHFDKAMQFFVLHGYVVEHRDGWFAQLIKPKKFSVGLFLLWTILSFGTLFWAYPLYYFARRPERRIMRITDGVIEARDKEYVWIWNGFAFVAPVKPKTPKVKLGDKGILTCDQDK